MIASTAKPKDKKGLRAFVTASIAAALPASLITACNVALVLTLALSSFWALFFNVFNVYLRFLQR